LIPTYISSVAPASLSGGLSSSYGVALGLGLVYSVVAGKHWSWRLVSAVASIPPFILGALAPFLVHTTKTNEILNGNNMRHLTTKKVGVNHPLLLFVFLSTMFMLSGICPLSVFEEFLFVDQTTFIVADVELASNFCQVTGSIIGALAIDKFGRKPVLTVGCWICLLSNILLSLYFSVVNPDNKCPATPGSVLCWIPAIASCSFFLGFGAGIGNVFFVLLGELVPANEACRIVPVVTFLLNLLQFTVIRSFLSIAAVIGLTKVFFLQAGMNLILLVGQGAWVPETRPEKAVAQTISYGSIPPCSPLCTRSSNQLISRDSRPLLLATDNRYFQVNKMYRRLSVC